MKISRDGWVLIAMFLLVFVGAILIQQPNKEKEDTISTSFNADAQGVKAFYSLLQKLGYNADRLRMPYDQMPKKAKLLIVVQPIAEMSDDEQWALEDWVQNGGTAIFFSDDLKNIPASFGSTQKIGRGMVYTFSSRAQITNKGMRNYRNAVQLIDLINRHAHKNDFILFDEYHHGFMESRPLLSYLSNQVKVALVMLIAAGLVLCYSRGRRFGAVRGLPKSDALRPGYEFVESVAMLYKKSGATGLAAEILCKSFKQEICRKLGVASDASTAQISWRIESDFNKDISERVDKLLAVCDGGKVKHKKTEPELLEMAREIQQLEKELGLGRI